MTNEHQVLDGEQAPSNPRPVSRGLNLQLGFLGIDSLYLVLEYPKGDVFRYWQSKVADLQSPELFQGVIAGEFVLRKGANGYKLSVWDGDARLYVTDHVNEDLRGTKAEGQGMGVMLQLGPKWLRKFGDILSDQKLLSNVLGQFLYFGVPKPEDYPARLNRVDIAVDVIGLDTGSFSVDDWSNGWVGYARRKDFHYSSQNGRLEGLSVGTSEGAIRFKVYNKVAESEKRGTSRFWRSVWNLGEEEYPSVARFEWTIKPYQARFSDVRFLSDLNFENCAKLLNYASLNWGRLCVPQGGDVNPSRWPLAPIWEAVRSFIDDWSIYYDETAVREYDFSADLNEAYLRSVTGWLGGFMARVGLEYGTMGPAELRDALELLSDEGLSISEKADEKWLLLYKLAGRKSS